MTETKDDKKINSLKKNWKIIVSGVIALVFIALIATTSYFYIQWKKATSNPQSSSQEEIASIKKKISAFIELPSSEEPTLATVTDVEKLKDQPFFSKAQNGDKVLIYTNSQKAILYRPSTGKIVDMMSLGTTPPVSIQNSAEPTTSESQLQPQEQSIQYQAQTESNQTNTEQPTAQSQPEKKEITVAVYNGTKTKGLAKSIGDRIISIEGVKLSETSNAVGLYDKNQVIDLTGENGDMVSKIISAIGGEPGTLPGGEKKPDAQILIIGGSQ